MPFLKDYLYFNSGNEAPENYHIWSALALCSSVISRKIYMDWTTSRVYPNLYIGLIGRQGSRKTTAKDVARDILEEFFPDIPIGVDVTSSQAIMKFLAGEECTRSFIDESGSPTEIHPCSFYANELKHFLGLNPQNMLEFLTDIYDRKFIRDHYKSSSVSIIANPYIVILACETPEWILNKLKAEIISGGFARRLIPVYEKDKRCNIPEPFMDSPMKRAREECIKRLIEARKLIGPMTWEEDAKKFYDNWYLTRRAPDDPLMEGFHSSEHTQILKVAMLLTAVDHLDLKLRLETIQIAMTLIDRVKPNMQMLYQGAGRNQLARPMELLLTWVKGRGGRVSEKEFMRQAERDMEPRETYAILKHLEDTDQLFLLKEKLPGGLERRILVTKERYEEYAAKGVVKAPAPPDSSPPSTSTSGSSPSTGQSSAP